MTRCYLDSSALVKLGTVEEETPALRDHLKGFSEWFTSRIASVEVPRALARKLTAEDGRAPMPDVLDAVSIIELDETLAIIAAEVEPSSLRSLDAIHLAAALSVRDVLDAFITYDRRLGEAGRVLGLPVLAPA